MELKEQITARLQKSLADEEMKEFFLSRLESFSEEQGQELLAILNSETEMLKVSVDRTNSEILGGLMIQMKALSQEWMRNTSEEIEKHDVQQNEEALQALEEELNSN